MNMGYNYYTEKKLYQLRNFSFFRNGKVPAISGLVVFNGNSSARTFIKPGLKIRWHLHILFVIIIYSNQFTIYENLRLNKSTRTICLNTSVVKSVVFLCTVFVKFS